jgi:hypothetical protein
MALPITNLFCETSLTIRKLVLKKVRAIVRMWIIIARLVVALLAGWVAGHEQRIA